MVLHKHTPHFAQEIQPLLKDNDWLTLTSERLGIQPHSSATAICEVRSLLKDVGQFPADVKASRFQKTQPLVPTSTICKVRRCWYHTFLFPKNTELACKWGPWGEISKCVEYHYSVDKGHNQEVGYKWKTLMRNLTMLEAVTACNGWLLVWWEYFLVTVTDIEKSEAKDRLRT